MIVDANPRHGVSGTLQPRSLPEALDAHLVKLAMSRDWSPLD